MQSGETIRPKYLQNLLAQFVSCTPESQQSAALALYCLTIWAVRNRVKSFSVVPCEGQKSAPLATTLTGTEIVRTGRQRSEVVESSQFSGTTHTDEFSLRSTLPAAQKQPCMGRKKQIAGSQGILAQEYNVEKMMQDKRTLCYSYMYTLCWWLICPGELPICYAFCVNLGKLNFSILFHSGGEFSVLPQANGYINRNCISAIPFSSLGCIHNLLNSLSV